MKTITVKFLVRFFIHDAIHGLVEDTVNYKQTFNGQTVAQANAYLRSYIKTWQQDGFVIDTNDRNLMYNNLIGMETKTK